MKDFKQEDDLPTPGEWHATVRRSRRGEGGWGRIAVCQGDHAVEGDNQIPGESGATTLMPRLTMALRLLALSGHQWSLSSVLSLSGSSGSPNLSCGYFFCSGMLNWSRHPWPFAPGRGKG